MHLDRPSARPKEQAATTADTTALASTEDGRILGSKPTTQALSPEWQMLVQEVEALVRELRAQRPNLHLEDLGPSDLVRLFNDAIGKRLPSLPAALFADLERNLADATFQDFADREVLRGLALLTYYSLQVQTEPLRGPVADRLKALPGYSFLLDLKRNHDGSAV